MRQWLRGILAAFLAGLWLSRAQAADDVVPAGAGSYTTRLPNGVRRPPATFHRGPNLRGKPPSNDWWSSLLWSSNSFTQFPHPLAVKADLAGLRVSHPGSKITANKAGIFGANAGVGNDLLLGLADQPRFNQFTVESASDWFVHLRFAGPTNSLRVAYGHGSPFVFATTEGAAVRVSFPKPPQVWSGDAQSATLGITANGNHYGLFAPTGTTWTGLGRSELIAVSARNYFSLALLPDDRPATLALFERHAHAHVTDTRVEWTYDAQRSIVTTRFEFTTQAHEGAERGTLFALYPHQWRQTTNALLPLGYPSVRGAMKLGEGNQFVTAMTFPGVLPVLPKAPGADSPRIEALLGTDFKRPVGALGDTYWAGKQIGRLATAIPIAEVHGLKARADGLRAQLQSILEYWFSAVETNGAAKQRNLFYHDAAAGALIGYPASYGSDTELNDHHFHYGYFIKAAAELARNDPAWGGDTRFGPMVKLLIRDIASPDRDDPLFPFLRCFDPYAGHSWASGHGRFNDGNNNESSSEAMNAWCGVILFAEAVGDRPLRDLGIFLFTTELHAIQEYWFDVHGDTFAPGYPASVITMVWGGKGANATWFSANPQQVHGINFLPMHGGSLYLGLVPEYVEKNYGALVKEWGGDQFKTWPDIIWMYRALNDAPDALRLSQTVDPNLRFEDGNSHANVVHWIDTLKALGRPERSVTADYPIHAVFQSGAQRSYAVHNLRDAPTTVTFSDGFQLAVPPRASRLETAKP